MKLAVRKYFSALFCALCVTMLAGCAAVIPSYSSGTGLPLQLSAYDIPRRVSINSVGLSPYDPVGKVLRSELPKLGFLIVASDSEALFSAQVTNSDYSPVYLELVLSDTKDNQVIWRALVVKRFDIYTSVVSASKSNAEKAMTLFRKELEKARGRK